MGFTINSRTPTGDAAANVSSPFHGKQIQAGLNTSIKIKVTGNDGATYTVGAIQSMGVTEARQLQRISEVGTDAVVQIVPNTAATYDLNITRIVFDYQRMFAAFQRGFRHIHAQRFPFDISIEDYNPYFNEQQIPDPGASGDAQKVTSVFYNCWFSNYTYTYESGNFIISEQCQVQAEGVYDSGNGAGSIAFGGDDAVERAHNDDYQANTLTQAFATTAGGPTSGKLPTGGLLGE